MSEFFLGSLDFLLDGLLGLVFLRYALTSLQSTFKTSESLEARSALLWCCVE